MSSTFRTTFQIFQSSAQINHQTPILSLGSCFSEHIGGKLKSFKLPILVNPFGIIFNPISIANLLEIAMGNKTLDESHWVKSREVWFHYDLHSNFSSSDLTKLRKEVGEKVDLAKGYLKNTKFLMLTFGTAFVYHLKSDNTIVANCHKVPAQSFQKELLSVEQILASYRKVLEMLPNDIQVILTVSPVRHVKDTVPLNSVSKSVLRLACHELETQFDRVHYFPSYELMMDDLRDYRFYSEDMLHPTVQAIDYIWDFFTQIYLSETSQNFLVEFSKIQKSLAHKPFHEHSAEYEQFLKKLLQKLETIQTADVSKEMQEIQERLNNFN